MQATCCSKHVCCDAQRNMSYITCGSETFVCVVHRINSSFAFSTYSHKTTETTNAKNATNTTNTTNATDATDEPWFFFMLIVGCFSMVLPLVLIWAHFNISMPSRHPRDIIVGGVAETDETHETSDVCKVNKQTQNMEMLPYCPAYDDVCPSWSRVIQS